MMKWFVPLLGAAHAVQIKDTPTADGFKSKVYLSSPMIYYMHIQLDGVTYAVQTDTGSLNLAIAGDPAADLPHCTDNDGFDYNISCNGYLRNASLSDESECPYYTGACNGGEFNPNGQFVSGSDPFVNKVGYGIGVGGNSWTGEVCNASSATLSIDGVTIGQPTFTRIIKTQSFFQCGGTTGILGLGWHNSGEESNACLEYNGPKNQNVEGSYSKNQAAGSLNFPFCSGKTTTKGKLVSAFTSPLHPIMGQEGNNMLALHFCPYVWERYKPGTTYPTSGLPRHSGHILTGKDYVYDEDLYTGEFQSAKVYPLGSYENLLYCLNIQAVKLQYNDAVHSTNNIFVFQ